MVYLLNRHFDCKSVASCLFDCVIVCDSVENSKYEQILVSLDFYYDDFSITKISNDKINILIRTNIIRMTAHNLEYLIMLYSI